MPFRSLEYCLDMIYGKELIDFEKLNQIYTKTAKRPIEEFVSNGAVGFKMRLTAPIEIHLRQKVFLPWNKLYRKIANWSFRRMMFDILKKKSSSCLLGRTSGCIKLDIVEIPW